MSLSPRHTLLLILGLIFVAYILFQARFLILGPRLEILSHVDGASVASSTLALSGRARNVAWLSLNDRQIFTDEAGYWSEKLIVSEGMSIMTLKARDRFGRVASQRVRLLRY